MNARILASIIAVTIIAVTLMHAVSYDIAVYLSH